MDNRGIVGWANLALAWAATIWLAGAFASLGHLWGQDSHAYWLALQGGPLYGSRPNELDAYLYSPAFAQALAPLGWLPWGAFHVLWMAIGAVAVAWLVRPLPTQWAVPAALFAATDLIVGNIFTLLAVMVALGARYPAVWAFGVLTKVTPGIGIVWLLARRDWRGAVTAIGVASAIAGLSWLVAPNAWSAWLHLLTGNESTDPTLYVRWAAALALAAMAAKPGRAWLLAVAVVLALPIVLGPPALVPLLAIPRLIAHERATASEVPAADPVARLERARGWEGATGAAR